MQYDAAVGRLNSANLDKRKRGKTFFIVCVCWVLCAFDRLSARSQFCVDFSLFLKDDETKRQVLTCWCKLFSCLSLGPVSRGKCFKKSNYYWHFFHWILQKRIKDACETLLTYFITSFNFIHGTWFNLNADGILIFYS